MDPLAFKHEKVASLLYTPRRPTLYASEPKFPPRLRCRLVQRLQTIGHQALPFPRKTLQAPTHDSTNA